MIKNSEENLDDELGEKCHITLVGIMKDKDSDPMLPRYDRNLENEKYN